MSRTDKSKEKLETELQTLQENGIQADRTHLKRNMHTQFADPFEFAREYVVNSYDALATECYISGRETEDTVTITIRDNGRGMNLERLLDYFKIFRSRKDFPDIKAIGRFGVGKMSVAAIPDLLLFSGTTSTGTECWKFETDDLIKDQPVKLARIEPVPPAGTKFEITIKKTMSLSDLLGKIHNVLYRYIRHLDIDVFFDMPEVDIYNNPIRKKLVKGNWNFDPDTLGASFQLFLDEKLVEVILGIGNSEHELYQNRVFITSKYNLFSHGLEKSIVIPNLMIRVNSEIFELTFGRHCLSNETILERLSKEIRERVLPKYFEYILCHFNDDLVIGWPEIVTRIEDMAVGLLAFSPNSYVWNSFPLFNVHGGNRVSFLQLRENLERKGQIYIEAAENEGADYSMFDAHVLKQNQPKGALDLVICAFGQRVINLNLHDTVIEIPFNNAVELSAGEKNFENFLFFQAKKEVLEVILRGKPKSDGSPSNFSGSRNEELENTVGICDEAKIAARDLTLLVWKVNYLVERDGKTPCCSRKFLTKDSRIILNLYHPEIREFVELSSLNANLSAHWAMAMCLSDPKLLPHITPEAREDILLIDAMSRISSDANAIIERNLSASGGPMLDFIRNCKNGTLRDNCK